MKNARLASCVAWAVGLGIAGVAPAQETVKLEYKLKPGMELRYKSEGTVKMKADVGQAGTQMEGKTSSDVRTIVVEVDAKTGEILAGQLAAQTTEMKMIGTQQGDMTVTQKQDLAMVCRADRTGKGISPKPKAEGKRNPADMFADMMLTQMEQKNLDFVPLPESAVAVGAAWPDSEVQMATGTLFIPLPITCKASSTLAEVKEVQGRKIAVIKTRLSPAETKESELLPMSATGEAETLFDIERGVVQEQTLKLSVSMSGGGASEKTEMTAAKKLDSVATVPAGDLPKIAAAVHALDSAVARLRAGEADKAVEVLEKAGVQELPEAWKKGIAQAVTVAKQAGQMGARLAAAVPEEESATLDDAGRLMKEAEAQAKAQNWKQAVATYTELADKYPDHELAPAALAAAATLTETKLNDKPGATAIRKRLIEMQEKRASAAGADPGETYKLGAFYADAGESAKAVQAYKKFLAVGKDAPANLRVLAQYRAAGLLEKLGRADEAQAAYRAVGDIAADDDYSKKLKEEAQKKLASFQQPPKP